MADDDKSHLLIYRVLGITDEEGHLIDVYQNKGRFLYRYAGAFLEDAAKLCLQERYPEAGPFRIPNTLSRRPKTFEVDFLVERDAIEIKWRDATTDGDHITKEHARIRTIANAGYTPIRVMFYYPNREQAIRIQQTLETLYTEVGGAYYCGDKAWEYVKEQTGVDLKAILEKLAAENTRRS
jgi:hypothetical protein